MSVPSAPPVPRVERILSLPSRDGGTRHVDLATRALVVAVVPSPRWGREAEVVAGVAAVAGMGADLAEVPADPRLLGPAAAQGEVPVVAEVATADAARPALTAGAALVLVRAERFDDVVAQDGPDAEAEPARPGSVPNLARSEQVVAVVDGAAAARDALEAHPTRLVAVDVTGRSGADAVSEESLALAVGVRLVRTADVRRTRRVVEVMAHLLEARR